LNVLALIPLITACFYLALLALVSQQFGQRTGRNFAYYLIAAGFWSFSSFMLHLNAPESQTLFWNQVVVVALIATAIVYYRFTLVYTDRRLGFLLYSGYALLVAMAVLSFTGHIVEYSYVVDGVVHHELGYMLFVIGAIALVYSVLAFRLLIINYRSSSDPAGRNRTLYLIIGWCVLIVLTITNFIPSLADWPLDHIGNLANAVIIYYTIAQLHLLDVKVVARTIMAGFTTVIFIFGVAAGSILLVSHFFPGTSTFTIIMFAVVAVLLLVVITRPFYLAVKRFIDRAFYRQTYQYRQALLDFSSRMSHILNLSELAQEMLPALGRALDVSWTGLLLQEGDQGGFNMKFVYPEPEKPFEFSLASDSLVITYLDKYGTPIDPARMDSAPEFMGLWQAEREMIKNAGLGMLYPMKSRDRVTCILAIGHKSTARMFSHEDIQLVASMAEHAGIIIENAQLFTQANIRANTDELTGLYNHRHFHERLEQEIARGSRFGSTFSLVLMDIDLFKSYNDIYGHLAGDQVLRRVGGYLQNSIRSIDLPFRYGGEEFAIILPEARLDDAYRVAERIRKTVETKSSSRSMPITMSVGVANWPIDGVMKEEIIGRADAALYRAKQLGRNRTCLSSEVLKPGSNVISTELESQPKALSIIYALAATVDAKDSYTYGHSRKVSEYAVKMAEMLNMSADRLNTMRAAGLLHDIGKVGVPDHILNKKSALSGDEWNPIRQHPDLGVEILKHVIDLVKCLPAIQHHHEHFDGKGYPSGLVGENIPYEARILSIADAFDAMTSPRPYRPQLSLKDALEELRRCSGTQFDPALVETFCSVMEPLLAEDEVNPALPPGEKK
jgi:diguanylate cyclase (GGDEF)-like protein/putative nucleotidyltransferase with HDIG domain